MLNAAAQFAAQGGRIDAVINNAMLLRYEPVEKITAETLTRMTAIGINGSIWGAQALLAHYDAARGGAIINMASPVAEKGFPNTAAYSLVKGAIVTLTKVLAAELGPRNVRVNAIAPGRYRRRAHWGSTTRPNTPVARVQYPAAPGPRATTPRPARFC